jgi:hypothetical protein
MFSNSLSFVLLSPSLFYLLTVGVEVVYFHLITLIKHTPPSVGILWTRDRHVTETSDNTNTHKRQTSMPPVGFEPTIPASVPPQTYALDGAATGIGLGYVSTVKYLQHRHHNYLDNLYIDVWLYLLGGMLEMKKKGVRSQNTVQWYPFALQPQCMCSRSSVRYSYSALCFSVVTIITFVFIRLYLCAVHNFCCGRMYD